MFEGVFPRVFNLTLIVLALIGKFRGTSVLLERSVGVIQRLGICDTDIIVTANDGQNILQDLHRDTIPVSQGDFSAFTGLTNLPMKDRIPSCLVHFIGRNMEENTKAIEQMSKRFSVLHYTIWMPTLVFVSNQIELNATEALASAFQNTSFSISSNVYFLLLLQDEEFYALWEAYRIKALLKINPVIYGKIEDLGYIEITPQAVRRQDFGGQKITAIIRHNQPDLMMYTKNGEDNITLTGGFSVLVFMNLQHTLNFTPAAVIGDGLVTLPNQTLGGKTVNFLNSEKADISLSISSLVPFRASQLTFTQPTYPAIINCFFQQPSANSIRNIVTAPFSQKLWISLLTTWVIIILVVKGSARLHRYASHPEQPETPASSVEKDKNQTLLFEPNPDLPFTVPWSNWDNYNYNFGIPERRLEIAMDKDKGKSKSSLEKIQSKPEVYENDVQFASEIGMWAFTANCQKSCHIIPDSIPMRMIFYIGILCGVVSYVGYSGAITSTLTVTIVPVKQFSDIAKFNFKFTVHEKSEPFQIFLQLMIDDQKLKQKVLKISTEEEISHLLNSKSPKAFLTYSDLFYPTALDLNYTETFICNRISKVEVSPVLYKSGMFLKKGSQFREIFDHRIIMMKERGFIYRYIKTYETGNIFPCGGSGGSKVDPIQINDVFTVFLLVGFGLTCSAILLTVEIIVKKGIICKKPAGNSSKGT